MDVMRNLTRDLGTLAVVVLLFAVMAWLLTHVSMSVGTITPADTTTTTDYRDAPAAVDSSLVLPLLINEGH